MSEPRIPPRPSSDWDAEVLDALSVHRSPRTTRPAQGQEQQGQPEKPKKRPESNILGTFTWHPALTKAFFAFNNHLHASTLPDRTREMVIVRTCWLRRGEYEWAQHARMARNAGMSQEEIDAISLGPGSPAWGPLDAAVLRAADEIVADRYITDKTWNELAEHLDRKQLMDLVFTIGNYDLLSMAFNNFGLQLDPGLQGFPPDKGQ